MGKLAQITKTTIDTFVRFWNVIKPVRDIIGSLVQQTKSLTDLLVNPLIFKIKVPALPKIKLIFASVKQADLPKFPKIRLIFAKIRQIDLPTLPKFSNPRLTFQRIQITDLPKLPSLPKVVIPFDLVGTAKALRDEFDRTLRAYGAFRTRIKISPAISLDNRGTSRAFRDALKQTTWGPYAISITASARDAIVKLRSASVDFSLTAWKVPLGAVIDLKNAVVENLNIRVASYKVTITDFVSKLRTQIDDVLRVSSAFRASMKISPAISLDNRGFMTKLQNAIDLLPKDHPLRINIDDLRLNIKGILTSPLKILDFKLDLPDLINKVDNALTRPLDAIESLKLRINSFQISLNDVNFKKSLRAAIADSVRRTGTLPVSGLSLSVVFGKLSNTINVSGLRTLVSNLIRPGMIAGAVLGVAAAFKGAGGALIGGKFKFGIRGAIRGAAGLGKAWGLGFLIEQALKLVIPPIAEKAGVDLSSGISGKIWSEAFSIEAAIGGTLGAVVGAIVGSIVPGLGTVVGGALGFAIGTAIGTAVGYFRDEIWGFISAIAERFMTFARWVNERFGPLFIVTIKILGTAVFETAKEIAKFVGVIATVFWELAKLIGRLLGAMVGGLADFVTFFKDKFATPITAILGAIGKGFELLTGVVSKVVEFIGAGLNKAIGAANAISNFFGKGDVIDFKFGLSEEFTGSEELKKIKTVLHGLFSTTPIGWGVNLLQSINQHRTELKNALDTLFTGPDAVQVDIPVGLEGIETPGLQNFVKDTLKEAADQNTQSLRTVMDEFPTLFADDTTRSHYDVSDYITQELADDIGASLVSHMNMAGVPSGATGIPPIAGFGSPSGGSTLPGTNVGTVAGDMIINSEGGPPVINMTLNLGVTDSVIATEEGLRLLADKLMAKMGSQLSLQRNVVRS